MNVDIKDVKKHTVSIFGESYILTSDESVDHINKAISVVDNLMVQISQKGQIVQTHRIAVLAAILLASENVHFDEKSDQLIDLISKI